MAQLELKSWGNYTLLILAEYTVINYYIIIFTISLLEKQIKHAVFYNILVWAIFEHSTPTKKVVS